ncbi:MAG TPA: DNA-binding response regulator [Anaerolinea thermolimosa]|uniref:Transcriptional regulatory protein KdpE n=1 Tax=Anaerolinea thermolimosa TaxID=229919 RepID=A0A3D1JG98_9CHLR|nr:response regulator [Anaerolinea thermolimosa]GAP05608.1 response regulators consisting of a CheY-like receiver domain and a winged-helix DNA-binding domain [Anaerolinea thermolimosa]HCE16788.1 DNA-binding response regulator [Anaerolinea thermolimosa]
MEEYPMRILVVDDERAIRRYLRASLLTRGFEILEAGSAGEALQSLTNDRPDLVILDLGLPDMDGVEVVRRVREWSKIPIIILSVRDREDDKVAALDAGADDYLTKPFGMRELLARIRVAARHAHRTAQEPVFELGDLRIDLARREVTRAGERIALTPTEYDLLRVMVQNAGKVLTHNQILRQVWGAAYEEEAHLLRVNISNLRKKIEPDPDRPRFILTEPGVGYRFQDRQEV